MFLTGKYNFLFPLFARSIYCTLFLLDCFDFAHGCICICVYSFNYYLPDFVTVICLGFIFGFSFGDILTSLTSASNAGDAGLIPGSERSPEEGNGNHSSILAWRISWTEEPGGLQSTGLQRVGHD